MSDEVILAGLKKRVSDAERKKMLTELQVEQARKQVEDSGIFLSENFGVESIEQAKQLLASLRKDVTSKVAEASALLDEYERKGNERRTDLPGNLSIPG